MSTSSNNRTAFLQNLSERAQIVGYKIWDRANKLTKNYVSYLAQAIKNFTTKGTTESVVFGYWAVFSLFPLVMLAIVVASFALGPENAKVQVQSILNQFIPGGGSQLIQENIEQAISQRSGFGIIGLIGLIYGAAGLFMNIQWNMSRIFRDKNQRIWPLMVLTGVLMMLGLALLIIASLIVSGVFTAVSASLLGTESPIEKILLGVGAVLIPLAINTAMFTMLFRLIPRTKIRWRALLPAALLGAIGWELTKNFFGWYVSNLANFGLMYGSLGTVFGLLTWTYLTGCFISLCAEVAVATDDWLAKRPPAVVVAEPCTNKPADQLPPDAPNKVAGIDQRAAEVTQEKV